MTLEPTTAHEPKPEPPKQHSVAARLVTAAAFATVGGKIGTFGMIPDANALMGSEMTMGKKVRGVFDGTLFKKCAEKIQHLMVHEKKSMMSATASTMKYSLILTGVGMIGGAALGWMRGGRIENWKDIITHPWRSTKLVLGLEKAKETKEPTHGDKASPTPIPTEDSPDELSRSFSARTHAPTGSHTETISKPATSATMRI